jgi:hypothetical protein
MNIGLGLAIVLTSLAAWLTHVFTCFSEGLWGFLIAGALIVPIGIIHGVWLWFQ